MERTLQEHQQGASPRNGPNDTDLASLEIRLGQVKRSYKKCANQAAATSTRPSVVPPSVGELMTDLRVLCPESSRPVLVDFLQADNEVVVFLKPLWQEGAPVVEHLKWSAQSAWGFVTRMFVAIETLGQSSASRQGPGAAGAREAALARSRAAHEAIAEVVERLGDYIEPWMSRITREGWEPTELIFSPHASLGLLPLHAAPWQGQPLFEHLPIAHLPTPIIASQLVRRLKPWAGIPVLVGDRDSISHSMADELRFLERLWRKLGIPVEILTESRTNSAQLLAVAPQASVLHCALHSSVDQDVLERSGLDLADGRLTTLDIMHRARWERLRFVFLNSCDSGVGETKRTDNLLALVRAFFYAGASSVVASLWPVDDQAGNWFAQNFYKAWLEEHQTLAQALQQAMRKTRSTLDERPYYWAPFVLMGTWGTKWP